MVTLCKKGKKDSFGTKEDKRLITMSKDTGNTSVHLEQKEAENCSITIPKAFLPGDCQGQDILPEKHCRWLKNRIAGEPRWSKNRIGSEPRW